MVTTITILAIALAVAVIVGIYLYKSKNTLKNVYDSATEAWRKERNNLRTQVEDLKTNVASLNTSKNNQLTLNQQFAQKFEDAEKNYQEIIKSLEHSRDGWKGKFTQLDKRNKELTKENADLKSRINNDVMLIEKLRHQVDELFQEKEALFKPNEGVSEESPADDSTDADNAPADNVTATADNVEWESSAASPAPYGEAEQEQVEEQAQAQAPASTEQESNDLPEKGQQESSVQDSTPVEMPPIPPYPAEKKLPKRFRKKGKKYGKSVKTLPQE